jgi:hypothetical protein
VSESVNVSLHVVSHVHLVQPHLAGIREGSCSIIYANQSNTEYFQ